MTVRVRSELRGFKKAQAQLRLAKSGRHLGLRNLGGVTRRLAEIILERAQQHAPKRTGELVSSGEIVPLSNNDSWQVRFTADHAIPIEAGVNPRMPGRRAPRGAGFMTLALTEAQAAFERELGLGRSRVT